MALKLTKSVTKTTQILIDGSILSSKSETIDAVIYFRITNLQGVKDNISVTLSGLDYDTKALQYLTRFINNIPIDLTSSTNSIAQAYSYIKTLPEFNGAIDC
jgi:hypothetical protein